MLGDLLCSACQEPAKDDYSVTMDGKPVCQKCHLQNLSTELKKKLAKKYAIGWTYEIEELAQKLAEAITRGDKVKQLELLDGISHLTFVLGQELQ